MDDEEIKRLRELNKFHKKQAEEKRAEKLRKGIEAEQMKLSHKWRQFWQYNKIGPISSGVPTLGNCMNCGIGYMIFKYNPSFCPKKIEENKAKEEE